MYSTVLWKSACTHPHVPGVSRGPAVDAVLHLSVGPGLLGRAAPVVAPPVVVAVAVAGGGDGGHGGQDDEDGQQGEPGHLCAESE